MKKYFLALALAIICFSCSGQNQDSKSEKSDAQEITKEEPKGSWKVNKEFDEKGNLIRYDSTYSWSSTDRFSSLPSMSRDSIISSFESRFFKNFSRFEDEGFSDFIEQDSLLRERFFGDDFFRSDFGKDFMDIDQMMRQMMERQRQFLQKYRKDLIIKPEGQDN